MQLSNKTSFFTDSIILENVSKLVKYSGGEFCNICTILVKYVDDQLEANETQSAIGTLLVRSCRLLPEAFVYPVSLLNDDCGE